MKNSWKDYFTFSKSDRRAIIVLLAITGGILAARHLYHPHKKFSEKDALLDKQIAELKSAPVAKDSFSKQDEWAETYKPSIAANPHPTEIHPFYFDPNTLDAAGWQRLGIKPKTVQTIMNYRNKGGKFRYPEDIGKIYGLRKQDAELLIPYVKIEAAPEQKYFQKENFSAARPAAVPQEYSKPIPKSERTIKPLDINRASVDEWKTLPGIGDVLSARIVKFRDKLGGFISVEQVHKTYGISDSTFNLIKPYLQLSASSQVKKININTATEQELSGHPFVSRGVAKAIVGLRDKSGQFKSVEDIRKLAFISDEMYANMAPYLTVE
ncbi:MAG: helix-hairpin-helix domain-containing protein [Chitinophagaceae bacterium]|jgi:DNA uptake protein ComE-like DNA-binding protein|nr:helix-hairpin-helix domain-containing protein [Chitinophagaceae bacterium]